MAASTIAGDYPSMCSVVPMILSEGTITVTARAYSSRGLYETVATFGSELRKGDPIALAAGETVTYDNTGGLTCATRVSGHVNYHMRGRIVSEPRWVGSPPSTAGTYPNLATNISNKYFRIADVELWGVQKVHAVRFVTDNKQTIGLGSTGRICVSAASSYSAHQISTQDITAVTWGAFNVNLTYRVSGTAGTVYTNLIGSPSGVDIPVLV